MFIKKCCGYELHKEKPNTSEDYFNRSEVVYVEEGEEKILQVLYLRYFDEKLNEFTPYNQDPIFEEVTFKDIVALACLMKNPRFRHRKHIYINTISEFMSYFQDIDFAEFPNIFRSLKEKQGFELKSILR